VITLLSNATINARIRCGNSAHVGDGRSSNFASKIATKPLQMETWLLLTAYSSPYLTVPSLTFYDLPFSHTTCVTDDRQTDDSLCHKYDCWYTVGQKVQRKGKRLIQDKTSRQKSNSGSNHKVLLHNVTDSNSTSCSQVRSKLKYQQVA